MAKEIIAHIKLQIPAGQANRAALATCERLSASHPREQRYRRTLWTCYDRISTVVWLQKDIPGAIEANSKARALAEALIADDPINAEYRRGLVLLYQQGGEYREQSDPQGALDYFRKAVALDEELLVADPANALTRKNLGYLHKRVADFLVKLNDWSQALLHFSKALEIFEKLGSDAPADLIMRFRGATCRAGVAGMQAQLGEIDPALDECRKTIALLQGITEDATSVHQRMNRAEAHEYVANAYLALAASPKVSGSDSRQYMSAARDMFQQSLNIINAVRESAGDLGLDEEWAQKIAGEIAKCDTALAK